MGKATVVEWLEKNADKYSSKADCVHGCVAALKCGERTVYKKIAALNLVWDCEGNPTVATQAAPKKSGKGGKDIIPADQFLGKLDKVAAITKYLDDEVKDSYIEDDRLRRRFGFGKDKWRDVNSLPCFEGRVFSFLDSESGRKVTVWSSKRGIENARSTISMDRYDK